MSGKEVLQSIYAYYHIDTQNCAIILNCKPIMTKAPMFYLETWNISNPAGPSLHFSWSNILGYCSKAKALDEDYVMLHQLTTSGWLGKLRSN